MAETKSRLRSLAHRSSPVGGGGNNTSGGGRIMEDRPSLCLSTHLLSTYKSVNQAYYALQRQQHALAMMRERGVMPAKDAAEKMVAKPPSLLEKEIHSAAGSPLGAPGSEWADVNKDSGVANSVVVSKLFNDGFDDERGNYIVQIGEELHHRFLVKQVLGKGSFAVVVKAYDQRREDDVAIKIIRNRTPFTKQAESEISILTELNDTVSEEDHIVRLRKYFTWHSHLCIVFELLSHNLYHLIGQESKFLGVNLTLVRKFGVQLAQALRALRSRTNPIIHGDLKPENILLKNPKRSSIKLVDFGSSCFEGRTVYNYIQSRYYRSPEVILGLPYDCGIDTWSLGCVLVELYLGHPLFAGRSELDQLHKFKTIVGDVPQSILARSPKRHEFYSEVLRRQKDPVTGQVTLVPFYVLKPLGGENQAAADQSAPRRGSGVDSGGAGHNTSSSLQQQNHEKSLGGGSAGPRGSAQPPPGSSLSMSGKGGSALDNTLSSLDITVGLSNNRSSAVYSATGTRSDGRGSATETTPVNTSAIAESVAQELAALSGRLSGGGRGSAGRSPNTTPSNNNASTPRQIASGTPPIPPGAQILSGGTAALNIAPHTDEFVRSRLLELLTKGKTMQSGTQRTSNLAAECMSMVDLLTGMLRYHSSKRTSPDQWLQHSWILYGGGGVSAGSTTTSFRSTNTSGKAFTKSGGTNAAGSSSNAACTVGERRPSPSMVVTPTSHKDPFITGGGASVASSSVSPAGHVFRQPSSPGARTNSRTGGGGGGTSPYQPLKATTPEISVVPRELAAPLD